MQVEDTPAYKQILNRYIEYFEANTRYPKYVNTRRMDNLLDTFVNYCIFANMTKAECVDYIDDVITHHIFSERTVVRLRAENNLPYILRY